jgi:hypothetical protein
MLPDAARKLRERKASSSVSAGGDHWVAITEMNPTLAMEAPGANAKQVQRAIAAAEAVFAGYATTAEEEASALAARDRDELMGAFVPPELVGDGGPPPKPIATARPSRSPTCGSKETPRP